MRQFPNIGLESQISFLYLLMLLCPDLDADHYTGPQISYLPAGGAG